MYVILKNYCAVVCLLSVNYESCFDKICAEIVACPSFASVSMSSSTFDIFHVIFYSRHSSDGRDWFLGDIHDEEEYDQFMKMIFISSNCTDEIQSHDDSPEADVLPPSSSEEEKIDKTKKYQKEYHRKYYKEKQQQPYTCKFCGKTLSDRSNIKRNGQSKRCIEAKNHA